MGNVRAALGAWGEQVAVDHLRAQGLVLLDRNWRCRDGEIDIVVTDGTTVVFVEVKTRSGTGFGRPEEAVTHRKLSRLRRLAQRWLAEHRLGWVEVRFDVVAVLADRRTGVSELEHLVGVF
ncbi:MAG: YraN family protein [Mycobacteriaceae bacterium]